MVGIDSDGQVVVMRVSPQEAELLSFALRAGFETTSRAEYWIRHGVAQPSVRALSAALYESREVRCQRPWRALTQASRASRIRDDPARRPSGIRPLMPRARWRWSGPSPQGTGAASEGLSTHSMQIELATPAPSTNVNR